MDINVPTGDPMFEWYKKATEQGVPVIPPRRPVPLDPNPTVAICGACGLELKRVMGYSCNRPDCPCFTQITC